MTLISDLPFDLVEDILYRVPLNSMGAVRSTCKPWNALSKEQSFTKNALSKDESFTKKHCGKEFVVIMTRDGQDPRRRRFNLHGIDNKKYNLKSIKEIGKAALATLKILEVYQCHGLLLLRFWYKSRLLVWNPYLGQTRWINVCDPYIGKDRYDIAYEEKNRYAIGYDNDNNFKVLKLFDHYRGITKHKIYDFNSSSWRILDIIDNGILSENCERGVSLKGNTYFLSAFLICFDFTMERFGPRLPLPFYSYSPNAVVSVREEQLAVLYQYNQYTELDIWITTKIEPNAVSWSKFIKVDVKRLAPSARLLKVRSFFIDEKKKVAVVCGLWNKNNTRKINVPYSCVVKEDGKYKVMDLGDASDVFSYVPSHVPIQQ